MYHIMSWEFKSRIWLFHKRIACGCKHVRSIVSCPTYYIRGCNEGRWTYKANINIFKMKSVKQSKEYIRLHWKKIKRNKQKEEKKEK